MPGETTVTAARLPSGRVIGVEVAYPEGRRPVSVADLQLADAMAAASEVAELVRSVVERVKPTEASVEFGIDVSAESGQLTALLVKGSGSASLKITLTWKEQKNES